MTPAERRAKIETWKNRAEECRVVAALSKDIHCRFVLCNVAESYDKMVAWVLTLECKDEDSH